MIEIIALRNRPVIIGKVGENGTRKVVFNISDWVEEYGSCTAQLLHQRSGDTSPYPCTITRTDGKVEWTVSNSDTEKVGTGQLQLNYTDNGKVVKSSIWNTIVEPSLGTATTPPEPYQSWVDEVLEAAETAEDAAESAQEAAEAVEDRVPAPTSADANKVLKVKSDASGTEWATVPSVINNVTSTSTTDALSANMGKELQDQITHLESVGRFLSLWNAVTGLPTTNPTTSPYAYKTGDYFRVSNVSGGVTNYRPSGSSYTTGVASSTVETATLGVGYVYYYDGTQWMLQSAGGSSSGATWGQITGTLSYQTDLQTALNGKQSQITASGLLKGNGSGTVTAAVAGTDYVNPSALTAHTSNTSNPHSVTAEQTAYDSTAATHTAGSVAANISDINAEIDRLEENLEQSESKNLLNPENIDVGHLHQKGGSIVVNPSFCAYVMDGVSEGETYSVWKKNSAGNVESQMAMYITAWVGSTAVSDKGATNAHEYTVPADVTRIDFSIYLASIEGVIEIVKGTANPSPYTDYEPGAWIAKDAFIPGAITRITALESKNTNLKIYNIMDYGAVGTGSNANATADTTALINALSAGAGAVVYIPKGTYYINMAITIPSNTILCGEGNSSKLVMADGTAYASFTPITWRSNKGTMYSMITTAVNSSNITIKDISIDGGTKTTTDGIWLLSLYQTTHCKVENVSVTNLNYVATRTSEVYAFGIFAFHSDDVIISNCYVIYCGYENIGAEYCDHVTVRDCYLAEAWRVPLQFHQGCHDVKVINNTIVSTTCAMTHSLLTLHGQATTDFDDSVSDVVIDGNYFKGVTIDSSSYPYRGGIQGVWQNEQNVRITNNTFDCSKFCITNATDRQEGTYVHGGWFIEGNTFSCANAINLIADNVICKNNCIDSTGTAIAIASKTSGSARMIDDNIFLNDSTVTNVATR